MEIRHLAPAQNSDDLALLRRVRTLMEDLGVNLAGVEVILRMSQQIAQLQAESEEINAELARLKEELA